MIKVFLREKKLLHGKRGLYLDFYPPIVHPETLRSTRREHLRLYVFERPRTETQRDHNKETKLIGENIRSQRQLDLQAGAYGFVASRNRQRDFVAHFATVCETKNRLSKATRGRWKSMLKHLKSYSGGKVKFADLNKSFCVGFRDYLHYSAGLGPNTAAGYFDGFRSVVKAAAESKLLTINPLRDVPGIKGKKTQRNYLTLDELRRLSATECPLPDLRRAGLLASMTGLRWSDVSKLIWSEIQHSKEQGYYIRFRQQKTDDPETLPISDEAFDLLGDRGPDAERVFPRLSKWQVNYYLPIWIKAAGISKKFTFHCFRHSFATLQLTLGTDIYTVAKMLGHSNLATTQIYAKIIDATKREAADRISLK